MKGYMNSDNTVFIQTHSPEGMVIFDIYHMTNN